MASAEPQDEQPAPRKRKTGRPSKFTPETRAAILAATRKGSFAWVAAEAAGVSYETFRRWMHDKRRRFRGFRAEVEKAHAEARVEAEHAVFRGDRAAWLRLGPGRDRGDDRPGWTESQKVDVKHSGDPSAPVRIEVVWSDDWRPSPPKPPEKETP